MKEKIKTISKIFLWLLIIIFLLLLIAKEIIYINAYKDCIESLGRGIQENVKTWLCIRTLNGASQE